MKRLIVAGLALFLLIGAAFIQSNYDSQTRYFAARQVTVNLPKAATLKVISLGFSDALAELIFIWSIQFYSTTYYANRWESVEAVFNTITDLDPEKKDHYLTGAFMMALEAKQIEGAIRLLLKAAEYFKNEYSFEYYAGYYAGNILKDYSRAAELYKKSSQRANAPPMIFKHYAHYVYQEGNLDEAWALWTQIKNTATYESARIGADSHLYMIQFKRDQAGFSKIIAAFKEKHNRLPISLEEMVDKRFITTVPLDIKGNVYGFNAQTGELISNKKVAWK